MKAKSLSVLFADKDSQKRIKRIICRQNVTRFCFFFQSE